MPYTAAVSPVLAWATTEQVAAAASVHETTVGSGSNRAFCRPRGLDVSGRLLDPDRDAQTHPRPGRASGSGPGRASGFGGGNRKMT